MKKIIIIAMVLILLPALSLALSIECDSCTVNQCSCDTTCNGIMRVWKGSNCEGIWDYEFAVTKKSVVWYPPSSGTYYANVFDGNDYCASCLPIIVKRAGTPDVTTTLPDKVDCPDEYECCEGETGYRDKYCDVGEVCENNKCVSEAGGGISWIVWVIILIIIIAVAAFLFLRKKKVTKISYKDLYRKWPGRRKSKSI